MRILRFRGRWTVSFPSGVAGVTLAAIILATNCGPSVAQTSSISENFGPWPLSTERATHGTQIWFGGDFGANGWSTYTGATFAFGGDVTAPGWRLRMVGGYSRFDYERELDDDIPVSDKSSELRKAVADDTGTSTFADVFVGYQAQVGPTTLKAFGGASVQNVDVEPPESTVNDAAVGLYKLNKLSSLGLGGALETWTNLPNGFALKADLSVKHYFDADVDFSAIKLDLLLGRHFGDRLFLGIESSIARNLDYGRRRLPDGSDYDIWCPPSQDPFCIDKPRYLTTYSVGAYGSYRFGETMALSVSGGFTSTETLGDGAYGRLQIGYDF